MVNEPIPVEETPEGTLSLSSIKERVQRDQRMKHEDNEAVTSASRNESVNPIEALRSTEKRLHTGTAPIGNTSPE